MRNSGSPVESRAGVFPVGARSSGAAGVARDLGAAGWKPRAISTDKGPEFRVRSRTTPPSIFARSTVRTIEPRVFNLVGRLLDVPLFDDYDLNRPKLRESPAHPTRKV